MGVYPAVVTLGVYPAFPVPGVARERGVFTLEERCAAVLCGLHPGTAAGEARRVPGLVERCARPAGHRGPHVGWADSVWTEV